MSTRITIKPRKQNVNVTAPAKNRIAINTGGHAGGLSGIDTVVELKDVDATDVDNNETLVYDESSGKFVVKEIPIINGGTF